MDEVPDEHDDADGAFDDEDDADQPGERAGDDVDALRETPDQDGATPSGERSDGVVAALATRLRQARFRRWFRLHFAAAIAWFALGGVIGVVLIQTTSPEALSQLTNDGAAFPDNFTATAIAVNNLIALGIDALGLVSVGLASVLMLLLNGVIVGALLAATAGEASLLLLAALIVPHGVLELGAFWMVAGIAFRIYHRLGRYILGYDEAPLTRQELFEAAVLLGLAVPMIVVAAVIEVHLTPVVAEVVTGQEVSI